MRSQNSMRWALVCAGSAFVLLASSLSASADWWPDDTGNTVVCEEITFDGVMEQINPSTTVSASTPLFGKPAGSASSNVLTFPLLEQGAYTTNTSTTSIARLDDTLKLNVWAREDKNVTGITSLSITEFGDYSFVNNLTDNGNARVTVTVPVTLTVYAENYETLATPLYLQKKASVSYSLASDPTNTGDSWIISNLTLDLAKDLGVSDATQIAVSLDNILVAQAESGTSAAITKKGFTLSAVATTSPVPEPGTFALAGIGLLTLVGYAWRKRQA